MNIFLLKACVYRKKHNRANVWDYEAAVFPDLRSAVARGKKRIRDEIKKYRADDRHAPYGPKEIDAYVEDNLDILFEIVECDPAAQKRWVCPSDDSMEAFVNDPYEIVWSFDRNGRLTDRVYYRKECDGWRLGQSFRPGDERADAGTKFRIGDLVTDTAKPRDRRIYIVGACPEKDGVYFDNTYLCYYIEGNEFNGMMHEHLHEADLAPAEQPPSEAVAWMAGLLRGDFELDEETYAAVFEGKYCFPELPSYERIRRK